MKRRNLMSRTRICAWTVIVLLAAACGPLTAFGDSSTVSYQGSLRNASGAPVPDGTYAMTFAIYDALTAGTQLWTETQTNVNVKDGLFSAQLGSVAPLGTLFANNSAVWIEISATVGGNPQVYGPRVPLSATPYAKQAETATTAGNATNATNATNAVNTDTLDLQHANQLTPPGTIYRYGGASAPAGWLLCNGAGVSATTYPGLFSTIGYTFGGASGTFNLPNLTGKIPVGVDTNQTEFASLGQTGGEKTHTLTVAEMPSHTHTQNAHNHVQDAHTHGSTPSGFVGWPITTSTGTHDWAGWSTGWAFVTIPSITSTTATNEPATAVNQNTGGDGAHNNLKPYIVLNYIIKY